MATPSPTPAPGKHALPDWPFRLGYRAVFYAAHVWWWLRRPKAFGATIVVRHGDRVLTVKESYRFGFSLPGGGINRGETPLAAAVRELAEETGLIVAPHDLRFLTQIRSTYEFRRNTTHVFEYVADEEPAVHVDGREIVAAAWVRPDDNLPRVAGSPLDFLLSGRLARAAGQPVTGEDLDGH